MEYERLSRIVLAATLVAALVVSSTASSAAPSPTGSWVGTLELPRGSQPVALALARGGSTLVGSARQGAAVGRVRLRRGAAELAAYGTYQLDTAQTLGVVPLGGNPFGVVYETGEIRRLHRTGAGRFELSAGLGTRA